jgi:thiol-disulfide isomerase/thioredoxin
MISIIFTSFFSLLFQVKCTLSTSEEIDGSKVAFVSFYDSYDEESKKVNDLMEDLANLYRNKKNILFGKIDGDAHYNLRKKFNIEKFPTVLFFPKASYSGEEIVVGNEIFSSPNALQEFLTYVKVMSGIEPRNKVENIGYSSKLKSLTVNNFDSVVMDSESNALVFFWRPGCIKCVKVMSIFETLARYYEVEGNNCFVGQVNIEEEESIEDEFSVLEPPQIKFFEKLKKTNSDYIGDVYDEKISLDTLVAFLNEKCRTAITTTGDLDKEAGQIGVLELFIESFVKTKGNSERGEIIQHMDTFINLIMDSKKDGNPIPPYFEFAVQYVKKTLAKMMETKDGDKYAFDEYNRLTSILQKSETLVTSDKKLYDMALRRNILKIIVGSFPYVNKEEL